MAELTVTFTNLQNRLRERLGVSPLVTRTTGTYAASGAVTVSVADSSVLAANSIVENLTSGEQIVVATVPDGTSFTVLAEGRGYRGSTAAAGASNDLIAVDPKFPADNIKNAINVAYNDWFSWYCPRLLWDTTTAGNFSTTAAIFAAPANALTVEKVVYQPDATITDITDLTGYVGPLRIYPTGLISTGKGFTLSQQGATDKAIWQLNRVRWTYLETGSDTVPSDFPGDGVDLILDGAALYLLGWKQMPRFTSTEAAFHREDPNEQTSGAYVLADRARTWRRRVQEVAANYLALAGGASPGKVWLD